MRQRYRLEKSSVQKKKKSSDIYSTTVKSQDSQHPKMNLFSFTSTSPSPWLSHENLKKRGSKEKRHQKQKHQPEKSLFSLWQTCSLFIHLIINSNQTVQWKMMYYPSPIQTYKKVTNPGESYSHNSLKITVLTDVTLQM